MVDEILMEEELEKLENIIIDSHIPFKADKAIILRCSPTVLFDRLSKRNYNMEKIKDNLLSEESLIMWCVKLRIYLTKRISMKS